MLLNVSKCQAYSFNHFWVIKGKPTGGLKLSLPPSTRLGVKKKIYKYMTSMSKNVYFDKLDDIFKKYNNTHHSTIKMKLADVN